MSPAHDDWTAGDAYEGYMGRWSRPLARSFVGWMGAPPGADWLDIGCGTGALASAVCELAGPASVVACDPSESFVAHARMALCDDRVSFVVAGVESLPGGPGSFDCVASGLVVNFLRDPARAVGAMRERLRRGGMLGAYVWDYADAIEFLRCFWDEAAALDSTAADLDEGRRFPVCQPDRLSSLFVGAGLRDVVTEGLEVPTHFQDFQDFWRPFLRGTGPAPSYAASLSEAHRDLLRDRLASRLKVEADGSIRLKARAWAVRGLSG
jgi:SAM-dependent methyltransferase